MKYQLVQSPERFGLVVNKWQSTARAANEQKKKTSARILKVDSNRTTEAAERPQ